MSVSDNPLPGSNWILSTYQIVLWPNPPEEWIAIKGDFIVDQLDIKTACVPEANPIQEILDFIEESIAGFTLVPVKPGKPGEGQLGALINMIKTAGNLIDANDPTLLADICGQLEAALGKTDGQERPPDFVTGEATAGLAQRIQELMVSLGCE
jgi:hypothetical protein